MQKQFQIAIDKNSVPDEIRSGLNNSGLCMHHKYYRGASSSSPCLNISENFTMFEYPEPNEITEIKSIFNNYGKLYNY